MNSTKKLLLKLNIFFFIKGILLIITKKKLYILILSFIILYINLVFNMYILEKEKKLLERFFKENQFLFNVVLNKAVKGIRLFRFFINFCFLK